MLSQQELHELFEYRDGQLIWKKDRKRGGAKAGETAGQSTLRPMIRIGGITRRAHILIWIMFYGQIPDGYEIDHRDTNKQNNRIENLRLATRQQNLFNRKVFSKTQSGFKGVSKDKNVWRAQITINYKTVHLGSFSTVKRAALAYQQKATEIHGEFANF